MQSNRDWIPATICGVRDVAAGIREIAFEPDSGFGAHAPGSHVQARVLIDGKADIRSYSLVGHRTRDGARRIAVKREEPGRGGSAYLWSLTPGARLDVSRPACRFALSTAGREALLIAGGVGITPILGMAEALMRRGAAFRLLYLGRARGAMAYLDELHAVCGDRLAVFASSEGRKPDLAAEIDRLAVEGEAYVCGPLGLLDAVRRLWRATGRPAHRLVYESFGTSGHAESKPFTIDLPHRGLAIEVPTGMPMLEALEAAGVEVMSGCRRGECGLCQVDVLALEGAIDHRDVFFSHAQHAANQRVCTCVSRVSDGGRITLDLAWRRDDRLRSGKELTAPP